MKRKQTLRETNTVRTTNNKVIVFMYEADLKWQSCGSLVTTCVTV